MKKTALLITTVMILAGCKASVEGETKRWTTNKQKVQTMTALHSSFKKPLKQQLKKATALFDAAKEIGDKEQSAKKMARANSMLASGIVGKLESVDRKKKKLRDKIVTATTKARAKSDRLAAKLAAKDARRVLREVDRRLEDGASSVSAATAVLTRLNSDLDGSLRRMDKVIRSAKQKLKAKKGKKGKKGKPGAAPADRKAKPAAAGKWKCEYCDKMHADKLKKCPNCGADR